MAQRRDPSDEGGADDGSRLPAVLTGDQVRLNLEIIKFARMHVREAGVVFRHVEHDQSELTASGPPETIGGSPTSRG